MEMGLLRQADNLKNERNRDMKSFNPLQITALAVLSIMVVVLAIAAFATAGSLSTDTTPIDIAAATATPQIVHINIAEPTPSPTSIPMPTAEPSVLHSNSPTPSGKPSQEVKRDGFCTLTIDGTDITVNYGVEEDTLKKSPGFLPSSALPGTEGTCAIYGHRNRSHFKVLKNAEVGDSIKVTMADGTTFTYTITDITIYESTSDWTMPVTTGKTMVLVTCYPFQYSGHAPGKCVVTAVISPF